MLFSIARVSLAAALLAASSATLAQDVTGAGATFPAPLYAKWADAYNKSTGVKMNYQSVGSGAGLKQIRSKTVDFGASDMPLKDEDLAKDGLVQFPTVIGGVVPVVNIAGIQPGQIKLTGQVLAIGEVRLGVETSTLDSSGEVTAVHDLSDDEAEQLAGDLAAAVAASVTAARGMIER